MIGGWKFVRNRPDRSMPLERSYLSLIEKAVIEDIKLEEIERFFPDDPSKKSSLSGQKMRQESASAQEVSAGTSAKRCYADEAK